jgi:PAS domain S-box-containing protein
MMSFSKSLYDPFFDLAHVYKVLGYGIPVLGFPLYQISVITNLKKAESALQQSEKRFKDISHSMADWIWEVDQDGKYTFASGKIKEILGYEAEEIIGKTPFELMSGEEARRVGAIFIDIVSKRAPIIDLENWNLTRDGKEVCLITNGVPILDDNGELAGYRGVDKDITGQKRTEQAQKDLYEKLKASQAQLIQSEKHRITGLLAAGVAHELSNPMMGILNFSQYCLKHTPPDDLRYPILQDIERETLQCVEIVHNLLTFARQKEEKTMMRMERCDVILGRVLKLLDYRIDGEGARVSIDVDKDVPAIMMRISEIQEVFVNLLSNALDAVRKSERKEIDISVCRVNGNVKLTVADSGHGISGENSEEVFDPFFTTKPVGKGTGLGLSITRNIIEGHGGEIRFESEPGIMTRFEVFLPIERSEKNE